MSGGALVPTGKVLYLDCFSGVAGDMFMGALIDLGLPFEWLEAQLRRLPVSGFSLRRGHREHHGIVGTDIQVHVATGSVGYGADPGPQHDAGGERLSALCLALAQAGLPPGAWRRAEEMFRRLGAAIARLAGVAADEVRLAGPGLTDTLVDVVAAALLLDLLAPAQVLARSVPLGQGQPHHRSANPIPSPLALELLRGAEVEAGDAEIELCTPTGAVIVAASVSRFGRLPRGRVLGVGYGAGDCSLPDRPNHLRVVLLDPSDGWTGPLERRREAV